LTGQISPAYPIASDWATTTSAADAARVQEPLQAGA
jgi:hypothetical protein